MLKFIYLNVSVRKMNKSGLLGTLAIISAIILVVIFAFLYIQIRNNGLKITTGNFIIDIQYNNKDVDYLEDEGSSEIIYNATSQNISIDDNVTGGDNGE